MSSIPKPKALAVNLFKNKPELMLRKMLAAPKRAWTSRVLTTLEFEKFAEREGTGAHSKYRLKNIDKLLQRWKLSYHLDFNEHHPYRIVGKAPLKLVSDASKREGFRYVVTGISAKMLAKGQFGDEPHYVYVWPHNGIDSEFYKILEKLENDYDLIPTEKKPNLILLKPYAKEGVFEGASQKNGTWFVSDLQTTLDEQKN